MQDTDSDIFQDYSQAHIELHSRRNPLPAVKRLRWPEPFSDNESHPGFLFHHDRFQRIDQWQPTLPQLHVKLCL